MAQKLSVQSITALAPRSQPYEVPDSVVSGLRIRVQPSGVKTYVFSYRNSAGIRRRLTIGRFPHIPPAQARQEAGKAIGAVASGRDPHQEKVEVRKRAHSVSLETFLDKQYGPWATVNRKSGSVTVKRVRSAFREFLRRPLIRITALEIDNWRTKRLLSGIAPVTINRELAALKAAYSRALLWTVIESNPLAAVKLTAQAGEHVVRFLSADEEKALRTALQARESRRRTERASANKWRSERGHEQLPELPVASYTDHLMPMVLVSLNTGLRRGELFKLEWRDVNLGVGLSIVTVRAAAAKSNRPRQIPLNSEAVAVLKTWRDQQRNVSGSALVFPGREGEPFDNTKRSWEALLKAARIERFRWHDMRHHFASRLVMAGVDLNTVRELLGHGDLKMTLRYAHLAPEHKAAAVERLISHANA